MSTARTVNRPVRPVELPGGDTAHVRGLTLAELRAVDRAVEDVERPGERAVAASVRVAALALVDADGTRWFPDASADDETTVAELLTFDQLDAVFLAAVGGGKDRAKN